MDLVGSLLPPAVQQADAGIRVERYQPRARRWFGAPSRDGWKPSTRERLVNRYLFYPRSLVRDKPSADVFHVVDHSYAHLVHRLRGSKTVVTCHDLDAFRCVLDPRRSRQPWLVRQAARRTMRGLQLAGRIVCVSEAVRDEVIAAGLADSSRLTVVPNGIHPVFTDAGAASDEREADRLLEQRGRGRTLDLLHVGIPVRRKRIDVALKVLARLKASNVAARLVRVGGALPPDLRALADRLGVASDVLELPFLQPGVLAAVYRRAGVLLVPSDREGFALPIVEALASGTPVIANDVPALRETGGNLASFRANGDVQGWCAAIDALLTRSPDVTSRWRTAARARAARFSWAAAAERLVPIYQELSSR
jgi:glycosyltransferase involved in cell wall biosynthesis